jgi:hypothetical protein
MQPELFCQSCTMPIDLADDKGTEKGGQKVMSIANIATRMELSLNRG